MPPILYAQRPLPLMELSPEEFESFTYAAFQILGPRLGLCIDQKTGAGGDGGFDAWGKRLADQAGVCVQCKRYERLALGDAAHELAKVAMESARRGSDTREHFIVVGGAVAKKLDQTVRETARTILIGAALAPGQKDDLSRLRADVVAKGLDADDVIRTYVSAVTLHVWSGRAFDAQLAVVWSEVQDLLERTFVVHPVQHAGESWPVRASVVHDSAIASQYAAASSHSMSAHRTLEAVEQRRVLKRVGAVEHAH